MDENKEEDRPNTEERPRRVFENAQKLKKKDATKKLVSDSDSYESQCNEKYMKGESTRKTKGESKFSLNPTVKSKRMSTIPCSSSEACEYDKENGEDEEDEGETTHTEYPELSSLLHDLCAAKYSDNLNDNKIKSSAIQLKNRRDSKTQRPNLRSAESNETQISEPGSSQEQGTSQTCDFISGLHYAIPFLSDKLKSSLFSRLRCQSEPKEIGATKTSKDQETDHCDYNSSDSGSFVLEGNPGLDNKHLPPCCHEDSGACYHDNESQTFCSGRLTEINNESQPWSRISPGKFKENTGYSQFHHGCSNPHSNQHDKQDHELGDNHHGNDTDMILSDNGSQYCSCEHNGEMYDCHIDNSKNQDTAGVSEDHLSIALSEDIEDSYSGVLSEDSIFGTITSEEEQIEDSVSRIAEDMEKINLLGHFLEERGEESSSEGSEMVPDLFSSLSSDSCQADDEFECDCGHCVGSGPGHHDNDLDLDWQVAGRLESSTRRANSHTQNRDPEISNERTPMGASVTSDPEDDDIEEGVYRFSLLPPLNSEQLEAMFERMIAQLQDINLGGGTEQAPPPASTSTIESLPYSTVTTHQIDDLAPCSICLSSFVVMDTTSHLSCNHLFHLHCIKAWLTKSATCPVCRYRVESPTAP